MKILVTGFEPFGGRNENTSWESVAALPDKIGGCEIIKLMLPTVYGEASQMAIAAAKSIGADAVISVGEAGGRNTLTIEQLGINLRRARIADNAGNQPMDEEIIAGGEAAYFSALPVFEAVSRMKAEGIPVEISYSAGTFVCNDVLYTLLHEFRAGGVRCGFLHVPAGADAAEQAAYIRRFIELI